jgi:hypothetical protein
VFISVNQFEREMGVDKTIGRFFVDRKPPENNSFWKGRLLYISFGNGFVSIPVYYDILYRIGVPLDILLSETHIQFMERLMHYAIQQEKKEISKKEELDSIRDTLKGRIKNTAHYNALNQYLDQPVLKAMGSFGLPHPSLNRADVFLYVLCDLPLDETQWKLALKYWYALHPTYLIMDDVRDFTKDKEEGEENVVIDLGDGPEGFEKTLAMYRNNCEILEEINPLLAQFLVNSEDDLLVFVPGQPSTVNRQR